ncbi:MAG: DUF3096 domain-containing protein [Candidatus Brocadiales bacterium]|nr:DUF3096 domain-containing protein [Candidatus Brocadiales bacterium]
MPRLLNYLVAIHFIVIGITESFTNKNYYQSGFEKLIRKDRQDVLILSK